MSSSQPPDNSRPFRACLWLRQRTGTTLRWGLILGLVPSLLILVFQPFLAMGILIFIGFMTLAIAALLSFTRTLLVAIFFARISILQILSFSMGTGFLLTLRTLLPDGFNFTPICFLIGIVIFLFYRISEQDPTGDNLAPEFFLKAVEEQRRNRENEKVKRP